MDHEKSSAPWGNTLGQLVQHWDKLHKTKSSSQAFSITLAREAGTRGTSVAREVGKTLGWPVYDHELLERIAQDMGVRTNLLESVDEKRSNWLRDSFAALMAVPQANETSYVRHLIETVLALGSHGQCVIVGRGASHILPIATTLRVRLIAPLENRISALAAKNSLSLADAQKQIQLIDRQRHDFVQDHFRKNVAEPSEYDLVVNFARLGIQGSAQVIVAALRELQAQSKAN